MSDDGDDLIALWLLTQTYQPDHSKAIKKIQQEVNELKLKLALEKMHKELIMKARTNENRHY